jgi:hypothetical protein
MPFETDLRALAAAAAGILLAAIPASARAHHGHPGESSWHDFVYLVSSPVLVLLLAAALVGAWIVVKRLRRTNGRKS